MDYLIQNTGSTPFYVPIPSTDHGMSGIINRITFEGDNTITTIKQEIYEKFLLTSAFFKQKIEQGIIIVLNNSGANPNDIRQRNIQAAELAYSRFKELMTKVRSAGGLANEELRPYLDANGLPTIELLRVNYGNVFDPQVAEDFKKRYTLELGNGLHSEAIKVPGSTRVEVGTHIPVDATGNNDNQDEEELAGIPSTEGEGLTNLTLEELRTMATEKNILFSDKTTKSSLIKRIMRSGE